EWPLRAAPERTGEQRQFRHMLMICDVLASIDLATRVVNGLRYISFDEICAKAPAATQNSAAPMQFTVSIAHELRAADASIWTCGSHLTGCSDWNTRKMAPRAIGSSR